MIIAIVLSTVTPSTVKIRLRSECSFFGRTAAIAMAADAPQIATAPPLRSATRPPGSTGQERKAPSAPQQACAKHSEQDGQDNPGDDQTDDPESQARQKLDADPDPEERHAETQNSLRAHGDPRHATTFLCKEMEGNTEQQRHQHRRRTVMIREESGGHGDDD